MIDPFVLPNAIPGNWVRTGSEETDSVSFAFDPPLVNDSSAVINARPR